MPGLWRTGRTREGRTHGARSEEERGLGFLQHTQREGESLHPANLLRRIKTQEPGPRSRPQLKPAGRALRGQSRPRGPQRGPLPSRCPGEEGSLSPHGKPVCVGGVSPAPLMDPGRRKGGFSPSPLTEPRGSFPLPSGNGSGGSRGSAPLP